MMLSRIMTLGYRFQLLKLLIWSYRIV
jgi:hypothetical protein